MLQKVEEKDWHGVADAAMDIREFTAKIEVYEDLERELENAKSNRSTETSN
jgi:hypothetical protein